MNPTGFHTDNNELVWLRGTTTVDFPLRHLSRCETNNEQDLRDLLNILLSKASAAAQLHEEQCSIYSIGFAAGLYVLACLKAALKLCCGTAFS